MHVLLRDAWAGILLGSTSANQMFAVRLNVGYL